MQPSTHEEFTSDSKQEYSSPDRVDTLHGPLPTTTSVNLVQMNSDLEPRLLPMNTPVYTEYTQPQRSQQNWFANLVSGIAQPAMVTSGRHYMHGDMRSAPKQQSVSGITPPAQVTRRSQPVHGGMRNAPQHPTAGLSMVEVHCHNLSNKSVSEQNIDALQPVKQQESIAKTQLKPVENTPLLKASLDTKLPYTVYTSKYGEGIHIEPSPIVMWFKFIFFVLMLLQIGVVFTFVFSPGYKF